MVNPEDIKGWISEKLPCDFIELDGDGQHFEAVIVSPDVSRQAHLAATPDGLPDFGRAHARAIHALSMKTYTPEEWAAR
jgi:Predicted transcriptional regulator, BolA superfamily